MRALRVHSYGEPGDALVLDTDVQVPEPGPGQLRVRVAAAALGLPDVLLCRGTYQFRPEPPFSPGMEAAGVVTAAGDAGSAHLLEQRVVGVPVLPDGALGGECIVAIRNAYPIPDIVGDVAAVASHIAGTTAHIALHRRAELQPGETLLVHAGAGGTGSAAIQLGRIAGARVIATAGSAERAAVCRELGAEIAIDTSTEDIVAAVHDATGGRGVDIVFDPVGGDTFHASRRCIASEGRILLIGFAAGDFQTIPATDVLLHNYSVLGVYVGAYAGDDAGREFMLGVHADLMRWIETGDFRPLVSAEITPAEAPAALERLRDRQVVGRVVVCPERPEA